MQCGPKRRQKFFDHLPKQKMAIEKDPVGVFQFCFQLWEDRDSSLTYFPVLVVLYL